MMKKQITPALALIVVFTVISSIVIAFPQFNREKSALPNTDSSLQLSEGYLINLTALAEQDGASQIDEYQKETEKTVFALSRLNKNPLLLDNEGTSRETIIKSLAQKLAAERRNNSQAQTRNLWQLNLRALLEKEEDNAAKKLSSILKSVAQDKSVLVVDELLLFLSFDDAVANVLKTALKSGKVRFVSISNDESYREFFSENFTLKPLFQPIVISGKSDVAENDDDNDFVGDKISPDLRELMQTTDADAKARVILQSDDINNNELRQTLQANGVEISNEIKRFNTLVVDLPIRVVEQIALSRQARHISLDRDVSLTGHIENTAGVTAMRSITGNSTLDGRGIGIAVLDSSLFYSHHSFLGRDGNRRIVAEVDFTGEGMNTDDPFGHGTHVAALAAGSSGQQGSLLTDYRGIAPEAKLINVRVLGSQGTGRVSQLLQALEWVYNNRTRYNIRVVNMSLGTKAVESYRNDPLCRAARRLVDAGVVVVAAAGNEGKDNQGQKIYGAIHSPGNDPSVITVGAGNTFGTNERADDGVASFSSRGPTRSFYTNANGVKKYDNLIKPDLVAPGNKLISASAKHNLLLEENPQLGARNNGNDDTRLMYLSGTSMAAPVVTGTVALMLQANPKLTPNMVKMILQYTAQPLAGFNYFEQGAGLLNVEGAVRLAKLIRQDLSNSTPLGTQMLTTTTLPAHYSTVAGTTFQWAGGVLPNYGALTGTNLITKYQKIYDLGVLISDGVVISGGGGLISNGVVISGGVVVSDGVVTSNGVVISGNLPPTVYQTITNGTTFQSSSILYNQNILSNGVLIGDGVVISGGIVIPLSNVINGDNTTSMR